MLRDTQRVDWLIKNPSAEDCLLRCKVANFAINCMLASYATMCKGWCAHIQKN